MPVKYAECTICGGKHLARGLCQTHYNEARRRGDFTESLYTRGLPPAERLKVLSRRDDATGCLVWLGKTGRGGYGRISIGNTVYLAHRVAFAVNVGPLSDEAQVCHRCDNPRCIEPSHLFLGSMADNMADKIAKGRQARGGSHGAAALSEADVIAIRADPRRQSDIAREYGVTQGQVSFIKRFEEWQHLPLSPEDCAALQQRLQREARGQRYPHGKLTPDDVRAIRSDSRSQVAIAADYGVSPTNIGNIKRGTVWKHVV